MTASDSAAAGTEERTLIIERIFDAPRQLVWRAWTEPEHLMRWQGPAGFTAPVCQVDLRVGGRYLTCMRSPEGQDFWSTGVYSEIIPFERIVASDSFADEHGNIIAPTDVGMGDDFPIEMVVTVTFEDLGDNQTRLTVRQTGMPESVSADASDGWNTSLDKLALLLATI